MVSNISAQEINALKALPDHIQQRAVRALHGSVADLDLVVENLPPSPEHKLRLLPVFYALLNTSRIPEVTTATGSIANITNITNILLAKESFRGVMLVCSNFQVATNNEAEADPIITHFLVSKWDMLFPWMQFFAHQLSATWRNPSTSNSFKVTMFDAVKNSILLLHTICRYSSDGRRLLRTAHATRDYFIQMWLMFGNMPSDRKVEAIDPLLKTCRIMGLVRLSLAEVAVAALDDRSLLPSLIRLAGGATTFVSMALKYVRRMTRELQLLASSLSPQWSPPQDRYAYSVYEYCASTVTGFSHAIEFIFLISETSSSCRELLLEMGSMHTIVTAISCTWPKFVSDSIHHHSTQEIPRVELAERKRLMRACFRYVNFVLYHADDSISALDEALKADLLESINRAISIPRHNDDTEKPLMKPALETLSLLPQFFGSLTIMKRLQHHQKIMRIDPSPHYPDPLIKSRWRMVVDTALPLLALQLKSHSRRKPFFARRCITPNQMVSMHPLIPVIDAPLVLLRIIALKVARLQTGRIIRIGVVLSEQP
ncbi:uncharacterized protein EDB91DRAFT_1246940 [Suillus paluster]|uniref:uncharacterized protein n=1 Tax=Suillus paluster TaxID=48578 RepID=UPI001B862168|nr:uncharacterized protein EDB91DRAFT_1246940 [Suillus paluster]KAG1744060.1 hypothetical protein EDB91DRAFT_1246940 [Suillus paluster]